LALPQRRPVEGAKLAFALRTFLLGHKAIAAAFRAFAKLAGDFDAAVRTGASHRGYLPTAFRTFYNH